MEQLQDTYNGKDALVNRQWELGIPERIGELAAHDGIESIAHFREGTGPISYMAPCTPDDKAYGPEPLEYYAETMRRDTFRDYANRRSEPVGTLDAIRPREWSGRITFEDFQAYMDASTGPLTWAQWGTSADGACVSAMTTIVRIVCACI